MRHSTKILVNTSASYIRIIANAIVTLIVTKIALNALGVNDFGLYNLLAGTIALLSFVNSALLISSQRYYSIAIGKNDTLLLKKYFAASIYIHIGLAILICGILLLLQPILFNELLNIEEGKETAAKGVYDIMVISSGLTMISIPYSALMNAYEDIAALSFINIGSYIIRLFAAISILYFENNLLLIYASIVLLSIFFKVGGVFIWCRIKYSVTKAQLAKHFDKTICKEMFGFAGWNTLGSFSVLIRDEGVAVVLNIFFGTAINAAYGIANQVNSLVLSFAANLTTVFAPSIIQAKGAGNEERMLFMAVFSSKMACTLSCLMALPILVFIKPILHIWLTNIPDYTEIFCQYIIYCFLIQQIYPGINRMIYATGEIKYYQIGMFLSFISILPIGYSLFITGFTPPTILFIMTISQIIVLCLSIFIAYKKCGLNLYQFIAKSILIPAIVFACILLLSKGLLHNIVTIDCSLFQIIGFSIIIAVIYISLIFKFSFTSSERSIIKQLIHSLIWRTK